MKISDQLNTIKTTLTQWASDNLVVVNIYSDLRHLWDAANQTSDKTILMLVYQGEQPMGDPATSDVTSRVKRKFAALLQRGRGFNSQRGDSVVTFVDVLEGAREELRAVPGISAEPPVCFDGIRPFFLAPELPIDAYLIEFSVESDIGQWNNPT